MSGRNSGCQTTLFMEPELSKIMTTFGGTLVLKRSVSSASPPVALESRTPRANARVVRPRTRRIDVVATAAAIEREHPEVGEMLESAAELGASRGGGRTGYSVELIDALIERAAGEAMGLDLTVRGDGRKRIVWVRSLAVVAVACTGALLLTGPRLGPALARSLHPFSASSVEAVTLTVGPGDVRLVAGDDLDLWRRYRHRVYGLVYGC